MDASLLLVGGKFDNWVYTVPIVEALKNAGNIVHFEAANLVVAIRLWCKKTA